MQTLGGMRYSGKKLLKKGRFGSVGGNIFYQSRYYLYLQIFINRHLIRLNGGIGIQHQRGRQEVFYMLRDYFDLCSKFEKFISQIKTSNWSINYLNSNLLNILFHCYGSTVLYDSYPEAYFKLEEHRKISDGAPIIKKNN